MIAKVNKQQYLQIVGLLALGKVHYGKLQDIEAALKDVLEVNTGDYRRSGIGNPDHIGDALYSDYSPDVLLEKLGIESEK